MKKEGMSYEVFFALRSLRSPWRFFALKILISEV